MAFQFFDDPNVQGIAAPQQMGALGKLGLILQNIADPTTLPKYQEAVQLQQMQNLKVAEIERARQKESALAALAASPEFNSLDTAGKFSALAAIDPSYADDLLNYQASQEITPYQQAQLGLEGQRIAASQSSGANTPSAVREYEYVSQLPPEEQQRYLNVKRAQQFIDLGGGIAPVGFGGSIQPQIEKSLAPENLPETRAAQTEASERAKAVVEADTTMTKKLKSADSMIGLVDEARQVLPSATNGALQNIVTSGAAVGGLSTDQSKADARLKTIAAGLVANVPRFEGPQSNIDVQFYKEAAGDVANPNKPIGDRLEALNQIEILQRKAQSQAATTLTTAPKRIKFDAQGNMLP